MAGMFDWLTGGGQAQGGLGSVAINGAGMQDYTSPDPMSPTAQRTPGAFANFLSDPNNQRLLADMGSRFSQGQSAEQAIGDAGQALVRRQASQQAGGNLMNQIVEALRGGKMLSPKEDNNAFDSITMDGDGNVSAKMNYVPPKSQFDIGADQPLESMKNMGEVPGRIAERGQDLPDFLGGLLG